MLLPYWTNNCVDSMEGLLMESSPTTPYHYLDQAELSVAPSDPQVGLDYGPLDVAVGVRHLQMLGVKYFMAFSPAGLRPGAADSRPATRRDDQDLARAGGAVAHLPHHAQSHGRVAARAPNVVANISSHNDVAERQRDVVAEPRLPERLRRRERSVRRGRARPASPR